MNHVQRGELKEKVVAEIPAIPPTSTHRAREQQQVSNKLADVHLENHT